MFRGEVCTGGVCLVTMKRQENRYCRTVNCTSILIESSFGKSTSFLPFYFVGGEGFEAKALIGFKKELAQHCSPNTPSCAEIANTYLLFSL